ncbi:MAG TPA: peptidyl-alpha-hydroxyglycine alpha-amidating lyase family protein [Vicinamibacterales bacterium]|nr:peptidyl-alpha-hydroxyglycine alpha-amidating lyase family protein [Vicinamibacterales bacterium]
MRRILTISLVALVVLVAGHAISAQQQFGGAQLAVPEIPFDSVPNFLKMPDKLYLGEVTGVATNSKGHIFVYTRTGTTTATLGGSRVFTHDGSRLFEFDDKGTYVREIGVGIYGFVFAHVVRVDSQDNIWVVDEAANIVMKFDPNGRILMTIGRKPESINIRNFEPPAPPAGAARAGGPAGGREGGAGAGGRGGAPAAPPVVGAGVAGESFNRPTDVGWDPQGNIFVSDGYGNSRVVKYDKNGVFLKMVGHRGTGPLEFNTPHGLAVDGQGNVYVADRANNRIQVLDNELNFKAQYLNVGSPWTVCVSPGAHQYLFTSNSNYPNNFDNGEIYKMELDGKIVGRFGEAGKQMKQFGSVHEIDCRDPNGIIVGELTNWRAQKLLLKAPTNSTK